MRSAGSIRRGCDVSQRGIFELLELQIDPERPQDGLQVFGNLLVRPRLTRADAERKRRLDALTCQRLTRQTLRRVHVEARRASG